MVRFIIGRENPRALGLNDSPETASLVSQTVKKKTQ